MTEKLKNEPILTRAFVASLAAAVIAVLVSFGVPLTDEQSTAVLSLVGVLAPWVVVLARKLVTPNHKLEDPEG